MYARYETQIGLTKRSTVQRHTSPSRLRRSGHAWLSTAWYRKSKYLVLAANDQVVFLKAYIQSRRSFDGKALGREYNLKSD